MDKTILIAAGGTGGHIFPALNLGKFLRKKGLKVIFVGRMNSLEEKIYKENGFEIEYIDIAGIKGKNLKEQLRAIMKVIKSIFKSIKIINKTKPYAVIGFGGYISFPVIFASRIKGIKNGICEQNAVMGFANRISSKFAKKIFLNFKNTYKIPVNSKPEIIGNFIKDEILKIENNESEKNTLLIFGGSQGAKKINDIVMNIVDKLKEWKIKLVHITGTKDFKRINDFYKSKNYDFVEVIPFSNRMEDLYKKAKVVISRAGATSISEIFYTKLNAILIPYPFAADNHQWFNAAEFIKTGKGVILEEKLLNEKKLLKWIRFFIEKDERFKGDYNIMGNHKTAYEKIYNWLEND